MRNWNRFGKYFIFSIATIFPSLLWGQDGLVADKYSSPWPTDKPWYEINPSAWNGTMSLDKKSMIGSWEQQIMPVNVTLDFASEGSMWGTKYAQETLFPQLIWLAPFFSGEGYSLVEGVIPVDGNDAKQLWVYGGWKYHLTSIVDIDIGGNLVYSDKNGYGPGVTNSFGWKQRSTAFLGLIGRFLLHPSVYGFYDFELDQTILLVGLYEDYDLEELIGLKGFTLTVQAQYGLLQANAWLGNATSPSGKQWRNSYSYWQSQLSLGYEIMEGLNLDIGLNYAGNNDGSGPNGIDGIVLGPENQIWFNCGVSYTFW